MDFVLVMLILCSRIHDFLLVCSRYHDIYSYDNMMHLLFMIVTRASIHTLWLESFSFQVKLDINPTWTCCWSSHGATESSSLVQPHLPGWGGPNAVYCHASCRCLLRGKVVLWRYPGPVGSHNLEDPSFDGTKVPVWDSFDVGHDGGSHRGGGCHMLALGSPRS